MATGPKVGTEFEKVAQKVALQISVHKIDLSVYYNNLALVSPLNAAGSC